MNSVVVAKATEMLVEAQIEVNAANRELITATEAWKAAGDRSSNANDALYRAKDNLVKAVLESEFPAQA